MSSTGFVVRATDPSVVRGLVSAVGLFQRKYTPEEVETVCRAIVVERMSARTAVEKAAAGELGLPAFEMPKDTASTYAKRWRREREDAYAATQVKQGIEHAGPEAIRLVLDGLLIKAQEWNGQAHSQKGRPQEAGNIADALAKLANAEAKIRGLTGTGPGTRGIDSSKGDGEQEGEGQDWAASIAASLGDSKGK